jgi:hypothetical protein
MPKRPSERVTCAMLAGRPTFINDYMIMLNWPSIKHEYWQLRQVDDGQVGANSIHSSILYSNTTPLVL